MLAPVELSALRGSNGRLAWLNRTRPDLLIRVAVSKQAVQLPRVKHISEHNSIVVAAVRDSKIGMKFIPVDFRSPHFRIFGIGDAAFMNLGVDKTQSQAGYVIAAGVDDGRGKAT